MSFWGTGYDPTNPACATGGMNFGTAVGLSPGASVNLDAGTPADYAGSAPGLLCGVIQINLRIPTDAPPGPFLVRFGAALMVQTPAGANFTGAGNDVGLTIAVK